MRMRIKKAIELRFGQGIGAVMLDGILRRDYEKGVRQMMRVIVHRYLRLAHRFEQRRLRFRRGAIDFIGEHHICENRPWLEFEILPHRIENAHADDVARQHVRSELQPLKAAME